MPKTVKTKSKKNDKPRGFYTSQPWQCRHQADRSELVAYVEASGAWETVAVVPSTSGASAETLATFLVTLINDNQQSQNLLQAAIDALELVVEDNGLTFSSEQEVDSVIARLKKKQAVMAIAVNDNNHMISIGELFTERMMQRVTYQDLVTRYGTTAAFDLLLSVERMAKIKNDIICLDEEQRFQTALEALNSVDTAANI